ncbi:MAG: hypothetical protein ACJ70Q_09475 [Nitrososphaera sp.]
MIKTTTPPTPATTTRTTTVREGGNEVREDPVVFERKLDIATAGLHPYIREHLLTKISRENAAIIIDYILSMNSEIHLSNNYRQATIITLKNLVDPIKNNQNNKSFRELERQDIIAFLDRYRKLEDVGPLHMDRHLQSDTCATW